MQLYSSDNCVHRYCIDILNLFDPELQLINTKPTIKNKSNYLLSGMKKCKIQTLLVLDYKKSVKLIAEDSEINEAFISLHQNIMTKIKNYASNLTCNYKPKMKIISNLQQF